MMKPAIAMGDRGLGWAGDSHPAWMLAHAKLLDHLVVGASAIGQMHLREGTGRDDAFLIRGLGPWLAIAVSDGIGSRPLSRFGASYTVESLTSQLLRPFSRLTPDPPAHRVTSPVPEAPGALEELGPSWPKARSKVSPSSAGIVSAFSGAAKGARAKLTPSSSMADVGHEQVASVGWRAAPSDSKRLELGDDSLPGGNAGDPTPDLHAVVRAAFEKTHLGLNEHARGLSLKVAELGCTALGVLMNLRTGGCIAGQVGDGAILGMTAQGQIQEIVPGSEDPQDTPTIGKSNFADFLAIQPAPVAPLQAVFVMSDGLSGDLLYSDKEGALEKVGTQIVRNLLLSATPGQAAIGLLNWLAGYKVKGSWDDRTLVVVTTPPGRADNDSDDSTG